MTQSIFYMVFAIFMTILFTGCEDQNNLVVETKPSISVIKTPSYWNINNNSGYYTEVTVHDQQGFDNIEKVALSIRNAASQTIFTGVLYDDGALTHPNDGDKMAIDGIFTNLFIPNIITQNPGVYTFIAEAADIDGNLSAPFQMSVTFDFSAQPLINNLSAPDTISPSNGQQYFFAAVFDSNGIGNIKSVFFQIEEADKEGVLKTYTMNNDGSGGDAAPNDSIYTFRIDSSFAIGRKGNYKLSFFAQNLFDQKSSPVIHNIFILSDKPEITNISMPDSLKRPQGSDIIARLLTVSVIDAQGDDDIESVYFYSKKPDGDMANNGNPIPLQYKGNGKYEFLLQMSSSALIGTYEFSFTARDKADNLSDTVIKYLEVY